MTTTIPVQVDVKAQQRAAAAALREDLTRRGILCLNLISSPGAGKTALLEATAKHWPGRMAVLVGDIATERDAERLAPFTPVRQLTTGGACHLEVPLVKRGLEELSLDGVEFLFIENVGNLVCPASHDLGEHLRVVLLSVTEGDDKPGKYPKAFRTSDVCVISKTDLLPHVPFSVTSAEEDARQIRADLEVLPVSARTGEGLERWFEWLESRRAGCLTAASAAGESDR